MKVISENLLGISETILANSGGWPKLSSKERPGASVAAGASDCRLPGKP
jgi:hypothetical protein